MRTYLICRECHKHVKLKGFFSDRWEVMEKYGRQINKACPFCDHRDQYSVDEVNAEKNSFTRISTIVWLVLIAGLIALATPFIIREQVGIKTLAAMFTVPSVVYLFLLFWDIKRIRTFNQSRPDSLRSVSFKREK